MEKPDFAEVLEVASEAGHILLENGAEISRVEDIMGRIATHYGVSSSNFFVLSNGIFTTGQAEKVLKSGGQASTYANVAFIPIRSVQLCKVTAVNRLSYDISAGKCSLEEAKERIAGIKSMPAKPLLEQFVATAFSSAGFSAVFGGGFLDCTAAFIAGALLFLFMSFVSSRYLSKIVGGICNAFLVSLVSIACWRIGVGVCLSNIIIGAVMPLIPGVPFTNGVRDLANSDYLAGITRMTDAMMGFFCIAMGVAAAFLIDGAISGGMLKLTGYEPNPETESYLAQSIAAMIGTVGFAVLYGVDRKQYLIAGVIGVIGWLTFLVASRIGGMSSPEAALFAALMVCLLSRFSAVPTRCPAQIFIICGIFTLVPGAGIFWFSYYLTSGDVLMAVTSGFMAVKVAVAIVLGIIIAMEIPQRLFSHHIRRAH